MDQIFHPHLVAVPACFVLSEILVGQAVSLLPVFAGQHQDLVLIAVVKAAAVWNDMIHVRIARLKQAGNVEVLSGVQAHAVLFPVQLEFYDVQAGGMVSLIFRNLILCLLVGRAVIILTLFHLAALIEGSAHFTSQFDAHHIRRAVGADHRVDNLDGLGYRSADHRVRDLLHVVQGQSVRPLFRPQAPMIAVDPRTRLIVAQSFFQQRNELLHRPNGKASVFAEGQRQQRLVKLRWNTGLPQRRYALRVTFALRQDGGNGIELLLGQGADRTLAHLVQRHPQLVVGLHLRPLAFLRFLFRFLAVIEVVKEHIVIQIQLLADLSIAQRCRTERRAFQHFTLLVIQRLRRHPHAGQAHAVQVL